MRYRAAPADALSSVELDAFVAVYHRPSGITHLLVSPAQEILDCLREAPADRDTLLARLAARFELVDADRGAFAARLDELVASGLVEASCGTR